MEILLGQIHAHKRKQRVDRVEVQISKLNASRARPRMVPSIILSDAGPARTRRVRATSNDRPSGLGSWFPLSLYDTPSPRSYTSFDNGPNISATERA